MDFQYDDCKSYEKLKDIFNKATQNFLKEDAKLIYSDVSERTLCGALKTQLEKQLKIADVNGYYVDVEYNRNDGKIKTILNDDLVIVNIQCDIIVHSRGSNLHQDNLIAVEMKKSGRNFESVKDDKKRLCALTKSTYDKDTWSFDGKTLPEHVCRYILGVFFEIDYGKQTILLEYYRDGKAISKNKKEF